MKCLLATLGVEQGNWPDTTADKHLGRSPRLVDGACPRVAGVSLGAVRSEGIEQRAATIDRLNFKIEFSMNAWEDGFLHTKGGS